MNHKLHLVQHFLVPAISTQGRWKMHTSGLHSKLNCLDPKFKIRKVFQNMFESKFYTNWKEKKPTKKQIWNTKKFNWSFSKLKIESNRIIVSFFKISIPQLKLTSSGRYQIITRNLH